MKRIGYKLASGLLGVILVSSFLLAACGGKRTPDPSSSDVRQLVLKVSMNAIQNALLPEVGSQVTGMTPDAMLRFGYPEFDFPAWQNLRKESELIEQVVSKIEEQTKDMDLRLENVRAESRETDLRRVTCLADLLLTNGNKLEIRFLAQFNEANQLYVEVELLQ